MSALFPAAPDAFGADELLRLRRETPAWGSQVLAVATPWKFESSPGHHISDKAGH